MHLNKWTQPNILQKTWIIECVSKLCQKIYIVHNENQQALKYKELEED